MFSYRSQSFQELKVSFKIRILEIRGKGTTPIVPGKIFNSLPGKFPGKQTTGQGAVNYDSNLIGSTIS